MALHRIGKHVVKLIPIKPAPIKFDKSGKKEKYVNLKGEELEKIQLQKAEYRWVNKVTGEEHDAKSEIPSKSFNGQPVGYQTATIEVTEYEKCEISTIFDYAAVTKTYQVLSESLKEELGQGAITFQYNSGRNYIPERAIVYYDAHRDVILMRTLSGSLKDVKWSEVTEDTKEVVATEKAKPLAITV